MRIAICDDMPEELKKISSLVTEYGRNRGISFVITTYSSAAEFLKEVENGGDFDAMLLDICMPEISGIEAAKRIRGLNKKAKIIFLTTSRDYAVEAFSLSAAHYLIKPFSGEEFEEAMSRLFGSGKSRLTIRYEEGLRTIELDDVEYFEIRGHNLYITLSDGEQLCLRQTLSAIREQIGENKSFAGCGASYIINLGRVRKITSAVITMMCGASIPIPRRAYTQLEKHYLDYYRGEATGI